MEELPKVLRAAATIAAPTTVVTAVLYYFGWSHAFWFFDYFGINSTILGLSTEDYLMRSVDGLFVPLVALAGVGLAVVWLLRLLHPLLARITRHRRSRIVVVTTTTVGVLLLPIGLVNIAGYPLLRFHLLVPPLSLIIGVVCLTVASRTHRAKDTRLPAWLGVSEAAAAFVVVSLGLFWAAHDYSAAVATMRAKSAAAQLTTLPEALIYSKQNLNLSAPGVRVVHCPAENVAYPFRYEGLKLVLTSGDTYLFLPNTWSPHAGSAIVLASADALRLEFTRSDVTTGSSPRCA